MRKTILRSLLSMTVTSLAFLPARSARAEGHDLTGEINLEEGSGQRNPYTDAQDGATALLEQTSSRIKGVASGALPAPIESQSDGTMQFLAVSYLLCTTKTGVCPFLLDAILESDIINSRLSKSDDCPNMLRFWKKWIDNEMEQRQQYLIKTGFLRAVSEFNSKERPRYVKCKPTVKEATTSSKGDLDFFKARYAGGSKEAQAVEKTLELLKGIKARNTNVYTSVGMTSPSAVQPNGPTEKKFPSSRSSSGQGKRHR